MIRRTRELWLVPAVMSCVLLALWCLPILWYKTDGKAKRVWFSERTAIEGWSFEAAPISQAAERALVADQTVNGEFRNAAGDAVRVFSAKRFKEDPNEVGLFVHTPDRCWVEGGWKIESTSPEVREVTLHGLKLTWERRLFNFGPNKELVYFCGLVDGQPLPYRLDHNLSVGTRTALRGGQRGRGAFERLSDTHFWGRLWTSFTSRKALSGPKQFFRISTPVHGESLDAAEARIQSFLLHWLVPANHQQERASLAK